MNLATNTPKMSRVDSKGYAETDTAPYKTELIYVWIKLKGQGNPAGNVTH